MNTFRTHIIICLLILFQQAISQTIEIKPHAGINVSLNYIPKKVNANNALPTPVFKPNRIMPGYGLDIAYMAPKRWGISAGVQYHQNSATVTAFPIGGFTPEWKTYDYNLWFPVKVLYRVPFNNGERNITFSAGAFAGYNRWLYKRTEQYLINPTGLMTGNNYYQLNGPGELTTKERAFLSGVNIGFELQPFRKLNGIHIGVDYSVSFLSAPKRYFGIGELLPDNSGWAIQSLRADVRQQQLSFRLIYNFSVGKHPAHSKWKFLNVVREIDSSYLSSKPKAVYEVAGHTLTPYVQLNAGWVHNIFQRRSAIRQQRITVHPDVPGYGIHAGVNYMFTKNLGVGAGFSFAMSSYSLKTDSVLIPAFFDSFHQWKSTNNQYLFHLNFVYRKYTGPNHRHVEYIPSFYFGLNQFFSFAYRERLVYNFNQSYPYTSYSRNDNFNPHFACGLSNTFLFHPFAKNTGVKFGLTYQIDFTRLAPVTYTSVFSDLVTLERDEREVTLSPLLSKLYFTITYAPSVKLKRRGADKLSLPNR